jgi:hypothetical protein
MRASLFRRTPPLPPRLTLLLALILFDVFLVCAAEHVGIGRPGAETSHAASRLSAPDDGSQRLLDKLRQPELLAVEPATVHADLGGPNTSEAAEQSGALPWALTGPRPLSRLPLHLRLCVWLV